VTTRNKIGCGAGLLGTLAITWGGCYSLLSSKLDKGLVEKQLTKSLGVQVQIQEMHLNWQGNLHLSQLTLSTPKHAQFGELKSASAQIKTSDLMSGCFDLTSLDLDGFRLHLDTPTIEELQALPPAQKPRSYPITIGGLTVDWSTEGKNSKKYYGPLSVKLPTQTKLSEIQLVAHGPAFEQLSLENSAGQLHAKFFLLGTPAVSQAADSRVKTDTNDVLAALQQQLGNSKIEGELDYKDGSATAKLSGNFRTLQSKVQVRWKADQPKQLEVEAEEVQIEKSKLGSLSGHVSQAEPEHYKFNLKPTAKGGLNIEDWELKGSFTAAGQVVAQAKVVTELKPWLPPKYQGKLDAQGMWQGEIKYSLGPTAKLTFKGPLLVEQLRTPEANLPPTAVALDGDFNPSTSDLEFSFVARTPKNARFPELHQPNQGSPAKVNWDRPTTDWLGLLDGKVHLRGDHLIDLDLTGHLAQAAQLQVPDAIKNDKTFAGLWKGLKGDIHLVQTEAQSKAGEVEFRSKELQTGNYRLQALQAKADLAKVTAVAKGTLLGVASQPIKLEARFGSKDFEFNLPNLDQSLLKYLGAAGLAKQNSFTARLDLLGNYTQGLQRIQLRDLKGKLSSGAVQIPLNNSSTIWKLETNGNWSCEKLEIQGVALDVKKLVYSKAKKFLSGSLGVEKLPLAKLPSPLKLAGQLTGSLLFGDKALQFSGKATGFQVNDWPKNATVANLSLQCPLNAKHQPQFEQLDWKAILPGLDLKELSGQASLAGVTQLTLVPVKGKKLVKVQVTSAEVSYQQQKLGPLKLESQLEPNSKALLSKLPLLIELPKQNLSLRGSVVALTKSLDLSGTIKQLDLNRLASFVPKDSKLATQLSSTPLKGTLAGAFSLKGKFANPSLHFEGKVNDLKLKGMSLAVLPLDLSTDFKGQTLAVTAKGLPVSELLKSSGWTPPVNISGTVQLQLARTDKGFSAQANSNDLKVGGLASRSVTVKSSDLNRFTADLEASEDKLKLDGTVSPLQINATSQHLNLATLKSFTGYSSSLSGWLDGQIVVKSPKAGSRQADFKGTVHELIHPRSTIGTAPVVATVISDGQNSPHLQIEVKNLDANKIGILGTRYPGMEGTIDLSADGTQESLKCHAGLQKARFQGSQFPDVAMQAKVEGDLVTLFPLKVQYEPAIELTGTYGLKDGALKLYTELRGHSLGQLCRILGLKNNDQVQGLFTGPLTIGGTSSSPSVKFQGDIAQLQLRGVDVGQGHLDVTARDQIEGLLTFAQPVDAAAFGQMAGISGIVKVTGVRLKGTPANPGVDPILSGPKINVAGGNGGPTLNIGKGLKIPLPFLRP
jgi:hypothetical protein